MNLAYDKDGCVKMKPFVYHGTKKENLHSIVKYGLIPSGGVYGTAVYTKTSPHKVLGYYYGNDALISIYHADIENKVALRVKKDWLLFLDVVPKDNFLYVLQVIYEDVLHLDVEKCGSLEGIDVYIARIKNEEELVINHKEFNAILGSISTEKIREKGLEYVKKDVVLVERVS